MRTTALGDVFKVVTYIVVCFLLAAIISPPLYEMGKGFAHAALSKNTADNVTWLATKADKAEFDTYFKRALFLIGVLGLFPLCSSLRLGPDPRKLENSPWSIYRDPKTSVRGFGQPLQMVNFGILHGVIGFILASLFFLLMAGLLLQLNWFEWRKEPTPEYLFTLFGRAMTASALVSIIEEVLFRGALLGIFLRAFRPWVAITALSLLFAAVHQLSPPDHLSISDPRSAKAGFELLHQIGLKFTQPDLILHRFVSYFLIGLLLGIARYRTASLWLPIGLHMGWVFTMKIFSQLATRRNDFPDAYHVYIGRKITEGLIPIVTLILTGLALLFYLRLINVKKPQRG